MIPLPPPDAALPQLGVLLDGDAMREVLSSHLPDCADGRYSLEGCRPDYVRYKPGTSCLVRYTLSLRDSATGEGVETLAHVRAYADGRARALSSSAALGRLLERATRRHPHSPQGRAVFVTDMDALVQLYPVDTELPALVRAASSRKIRRLLRAALPAEVAERLRVCDVSLVRYKPARKALFRYELSRSRVSAVYGKLHTDGRGALLFEVEGALRRAGVRTPKVLTYLSDLRLILHEEVRGTRLADLGSTPEAGQSAGEVAEALARLHAAKVPNVSVPGRGGESAVLSAAAGAVGELLPGLSREVSRLAAGVSAAIQETDLPPVVVHGDFYDDQVLISQEGVVMLDFDELRMDNPLVDVGNFLAHQSRAGNEEMRMGFLDAYTRIRPQARGHVAPFEAAALLKLAVGPFRRLEPDWPDGVERLVRLAGDRLLESGAANFAMARTRRFDPALPQLERLQDRAAMATELERALGSGPVQVERIEVVRHKPGRRCLLRYDLAGAEPIYAKAFVSDRGPRVFEVARKIASARVYGPDVALPEPVAYLPHLKLLLQREVKGSPIAPLLLGGNEELSVRVAEVAHALHTSAIDLRRHHDIGKEISPLWARAERLAAACPALAELTWQCLALAREGAGRAYTWRCRPIHRDFYHDQLLVRPRGVAVLDLDDAAMSEPVVDVANFIAHLRLLSLQALGTAHGLERVITAFEGRYRKLDPGLDPVLLRYLEGTTLLRLAEIHQSRHGGERLARCLLRESYRLLEDTGIGIPRGPIPSSVPSP